MRTRYQAKAKRMAEQSAYPAMIAVATGQGAGPLNRGRAPAFSIEHLLILAGDLRLRCPWTPAAAMLPNDRRSRDAYNT